MLDSCRDREQWLLFCGNTACDSGKRMQRRLVEDQGGMAGAQDQNAQGWIRSLE